MVSWNGRSGSVEVPATTVPPGAPLSRPSGAGSQPGTGRSARQTAASAARRAAIDPDSSRPRRVPGHRPPARRGGPRRSTSCASGGSGARAEPSVPAKYYPKSGRNKGPQQGRRHHGRLHGARPAPGLRGDHPGTTTARPASSTRATGSSWRTRMWTPRLTRRCAARTHGSDAVCHDARQRGHAYMRYARAAAGPLTVHDARSTMLPWCIVFSSFS
jgi:hypothetical protein